MGGLRNAHNILAGKTEGERLFERPEHGLKDMDLKEIVYEDVEWINLALDVVASSYELTNESLCNGAELSQ
jgi:hypothetical protein